MCVGGIVLRRTNKKCDFCGEYHVIDASCSGDWYNTINGVVLQSYCPNCGYMLPALPKLETSNLSNNAKKLIIVRIASYKKLRYKNAMKEYHHGLKNISDKDQFIKKCSFIFEIPGDKIKSLL